LSTADIGLCPDPKSPLNDVSTMNKTMEYMAFALPVLTFDLTETRVSAGESAHYVNPGDIDGFAAAWDEMLRNGSERIRLGVTGRERVVSKLDWAQQAAKYVGVWRKVLGDPVHKKSTPSETPHVMTTSTASLSQAFINLDNATALATYIRDRGRVDSHD
jgi:hypothetical protein